jgi:3-isopropylmalate/(R)-2-methylmalate dehydratase small subunit
VVDETVVEQLWQLVEADPTVAVTVDLERRTISAGELVTVFEIDDYTRWRLLEGLDDIDITLSHEAQISTYEGNRRSFTPTTLPG